MNISAKTSVTVGAMDVTPYERVQDTKAEGTLVPDIVVYYIDIVCNIAIVTLLSVFGIGANIINIAVYIKMGFKETSNISFLSLSVSDLGQLMCLLAFGLTNFINRIWPGTKVDPVSLSLVAFSRARTAFADISMMTTVVIAVERSLCVAMPFKFKDFMTKSKTLWILVAIYVFVVASYLPIVVTSGLAWRWDPRYNTTRLLLHVTSEYDTAATVTKYLSFICLTSVSQITVMVSAGVLVIGLKRATKFHEKINASSQADQNIANKNVTLQRTVLFISVLFVICNTPMMMTAYVSLLTPGVDLGGHHQNVLLLLFGLIFTATGINASANIFIYASVSSKFKRNLLNLFSMTRQGEGTVSSVM